MAGDQAQDVQGKHLQGIRAAVLDQPAARFRRETDRRHHAAGTARLPLPFHRRGQAPHGGEAVSDPLLHLRSRLRGPAYPFPDEEDRPSLL